MRVHTDGPAPVFTGRDLGLTMDDMQQLDRRTRPTRNPSGRIGHMVGKVRVIDAGQHLFFVLHGEFPCSNAPVTQCVGLARASDS